ncbi:thymus-specific serine protease isoform X2 [Clupea harengus]|uniref:Thymus-specific serine protease isoform X2 n=1 Tax=Clupea harengus TaxID=7950 RepID=A0A8M1KC28_CLUHA|nr:thymus-specific serine protease isoform X2 [Clupea harengus]
MYLSTGRLTILIVLLSYACAGRVLWRIRERVREARNQKAKQYVMRNALRGNRPRGHTKEGLLHQPLDHFDSNREDTFPQKFFVNDQYWDRPDGPVFLYIGGEGPLSEIDVLAGHHVDMAEEHSALLVALEHRFYGDSINPEGLETENLSDLSSQQALADLVTFHRHISDRYSLSDKNTWISFGGSYAGALSAWLRGKFPHLIYGAVASSAPVQAKLDFSTFNKVVGLSLMDKEVGGSEKCVSDVWEAFAAVEAALIGGNESQVWKDFSCCEDPSSLDDQIELISSLADLIAGTVEYNEIEGTMSIDELCVLMTNQSEKYEEEIEAYDRLVKLVEIYREVEGLPCLLASHEHELEELMDTSDDVVASGRRQWYYQSCTEFGFFQTCEDSSCPFSRMLTLRAATELCTQLFGIPEEKLPGNVAFTNMYYGGDHPQTHRVLYVNGNH